MNKEEKLAIARKAREAKTTIKKRFGEFIPEGVEPDKIYKQWVKSIFGSAKPDESTMFFVLSQAKVAGLDPRVPRQIYAVPFKNSRTGETTYNVIIGIEGLVTIAENTGQFGGTTKPDYEFDDKGQPFACTIGVFKVVQGLPFTSYQTVYMSEYTTGRDMWAKKPMTMLKKVALAHALRATFSACAGLYIAEEHEPTAGTIIASPDLEKAISTSTSGKELSAVMASASPEDKKRIAGLVADRMKEIKNG